MFKRILGILGKWNFPILQETINNYCENNNDLTHPINIIKHLLSEINKRFNDLKIHELVAQLELNPFSNECRKLNWKSVWFEWNYFRTWNNHITEWFNTWLLLHFASMHDACTQKVENTQIKKDLGVSCFGYIWIGESIFLSINTWWTNIVQESQTIIWIKLNRSCF